MSLSLPSSLLTPFLKKSQSNNGISHSNLILASVLGGIGSLIILGLIIGAVYFMMPHLSSGSLSSQVALQQGAVEGDQEILKLRALLETQVRDSLLHPQLKLSSRSTSECCRGREKRRRRKS
jgi:hypothetical protein